jgi:predicted RNase H-like HicB family nuclease
MTYKITLKRTTNGYAASVNELPGCWSQGTSKVDALKNIRAAIVDYVVVAHELRFPLKSFDRP